jgi:DNA-binding SARP family transcriptional activator
MDGLVSQNWELTLLGSWQLRLNGGRVEVGHRQQRVISALALFGTRSRLSLASLLWPDSSEAQAAGNLRASLFHITHKLPGILDPKHDYLSLEPDVDVDFHKIRWLVADIQDGNAAPSGSAHLLYHADLLPGWYDDWVIFEQERLQQLRLDGLEALARSFLQIGDTGRATEAALAATSIEPLRESAQLVLLQCHVQAGNNASALQSFHDFRGRLNRELGVRPSSIFESLVDSLHPVQASAVHAPPRSRSAYQ